MDHPHGDASEVDLRQSAAALQFGAFRLFMQRRQLTRNGDDVRIGARAFDLLSTLASRAGQIVSHAELIEAAWPKRVVADTNLKTQIATLQRILGHSPIGGRYIKNVPLRGYVFVEEVHPLPTSQVRLIRARDPADREALADVRRFQPHRQWDPPAPGGGAAQRRFP